MVMPGKETDRQHPILQTSTIIVGMGEPSSVHRNGHDEDQLAVIRVLRAVKSGEALADALDEHKLSAEVFDGHCQSAGGWAQLKGALLFGMFRQCDELLARAGLPPVNSRVRNGRVRTLEDCIAWTETSSRKKRQFFGSYYDMGDPRYLLHVCVGTLNLHIGFVAYRVEDDRLAIERLEALDQARLKVRFGTRLQQGLSLEPRKWGSRWMSVDCGRLYGLHHREHYQAATQLASSGMFQQCIAPVIKAVQDAPELSHLWMWQAVDKRQLWRMFVDGRFHKKYRGWVGYEENEPNSTRGMLNGLSYILANFDKAGDLDERYILELHHACMHAVRDANPKSTPGEYRFREAGFRFFGKNSTINSLAEIIDLRAGDGSPLFHTAGFERTADELNALDVYEALQRRGDLRYRPWYPQLDGAQQALLETPGASPEGLALQATVRGQYADRVKAHIARYREEISRADTRYATLLAIGRLVRDLELTHPFPDGNGRAFPVLLANHLATYHGFPPLIFYDPNLDAELSYAEFVLEMTRAMQNSLELMLAPATALYDFSVNDLPQQDIDTFLHMASDVIEKITGFDKRAEARPGELYLTPARLQRITGGTWQNLFGDTRFAQVGYFNTNIKGCVYFCKALPEWRKEGKDPLREIQRVMTRAKALVLDSAELAAQLNVPLLLVDDVDASFRQVAASVRREVDPQTVLVTGTEGKTGAKVQLYHLLKHQTRVHAVLNSANTEGPVLLSLANLRNDDRVEINEVSVGSDERSRVERAKLVNPSLCFFTNIGPNHMDMHKTIENIIWAKSSVVEGLRPGGTAIVNGDNRYADQLIEAIGKRRADITVETYGSDQNGQAVLLASEFRPDPIGWRVWASIDGRELDYHLGMLQAHAPLMSVGVLHTVARLGFDPELAARHLCRVDSYQTMGQLFELHKGDARVMFYDQSRRGAIQGVRSAFGDLARLQVRGKTVALVGGISTKNDTDWTRESHVELGTLINESRISQLLTTGNFMHYVHDQLRDDITLVRHSDDINALAKALIDELEDGDLLFIIGNAYLYLGRVADAILRQLAHTKLL